MADADNIQSIIDKVQKLLALAGNNTNENEAAAATEKAMALLEAYNLDMAVIGKTGKGQQRNDTRLKGGLYGWQRNLWDSVARLNFCNYWFIRGLARGSVYEHRILGSQANVASTKVMADYLQQAVERAARDYAKLQYPGQSIFIREMIAFREGMSRRLCERLERKRWDTLNEERAKAEEARRNQPAGTGGTGLVLASVIQTEEDLNNDYEMGWEPGTSAARRAEREAKKAAADAILKAWELANPEEAAAQRKAKEEEDAKWWADYKAKNANKPHRERKLTAEEERQRLSTFGAGYRKGDDVGFDKQVDKNSQRRIG